VAKEKVKEKVNKMMKEMEMTKELILVGGCLKEGRVLLGLLYTNKAILSAKYTEHSLSSISANKGIKAKRY